MVIPPNSIHRASDDYDEPDVFAAYSELERREYLQKLGDDLVKARTHFETFVRCVAPVIATGGKYAPCVATKIICHFLQRAWELSNSGKFVLMCVNMPPQRGKSMHVSEIFPAWWLAQSMNKQVIAVTGSEKLVVKMSKRTRRVMDSFIFRAIFPESCISTKETATLDWAVENGCTYKGRGFGGSITGESGHMIIVDDIIKNREEAANMKLMEDNWDEFQSTVMSRQQLDTIVLLVQTRWGTHDLTGKILDMIEKDRQISEETGEPLAYPDFMHLSFGEMSEGYEYYDPIEAKIITSDTEIPNASEMGLLFFRGPGELFHPKLHDMNEYRRVKLSFADNMPSFYALYQQKPMPSTGYLFNPEKINYYDPHNPPFNLEKCHIATGWDYAISQKTTADNNVGITIAMDSEKNWYIIGINIFKGANPIPKQMVTTTKSFTKKGATYTIAYEDHNIYKTLASKIKEEFKKDHLVPKMVGVPPQQDKVVRSFTAQTYVNEGKVWLPSDSTAHVKYKDVVDFVQELAAFNGAPKGKDDRVDAFSSASVILDKTRPVQTLKDKALKFMKKRQRKPNTNNAVGNVKGHMIA